MSSSYKQRSKIKFEIKDVLIGLLLIVLLSNSLFAVSIMYQRENAYSIPKGVQTLINAYPDMGFNYSNNFVIFKDGTAIKYDDRKEKTYLEKLDDCDIEDMFKETYDRSVILPPYLYDPGRYRCEAFFNKMYGANEATVITNLKPVKIFGRKFNVTKVNGVNEKLQKVAEEVEKHPEFKKYFVKNAGSFNYRKVRGSNRLSAHSYGIAIDINSHESDYWRYSNNVTEIDLVSYANRIPYALVKIFEDNGFIWGGRWYHYDTMHFEYRPELLNTH